MHSNSVSIDSNKNKINCQATPSLRTLRVKYCAKKHRNYETVTYRGKDAKRIRRIELLKRKIK